MCGIAGIYDAAGRDKMSDNTVRQMTSVLNHRGPDESGFYLDEHIGLGHARLSIIDLAGGTQPICNEDKTLWIVYNGEVFNYKELARGLVEKGHRFYTSSDTEVVLHLYEEYGAQCLEKLNGQFAMAIWDSKKRELFVARDRFGIRPLHYTVDKGRFLFASEIKSIFCDPSIRRNLDPIAIDQTFTFWTTLAGRTAFKGINELPPGHYMTVSKGNVKIKRYWQLPLSAPADQLDLSPKHICEQIRELLLDSIRLRLRADVPVGSYLSGGLDSSGLTSLIVKNFDSDIRSFGIRFAENDYDEGLHQQNMVKFLNTNHSEIVATNQDIGRCLSRVLWHCEKPLLRTSPIPLYLLSNLVRNSGIKVAITGEGADEVFGGYNIFREAKVRRFWSRYPDSKARAALLGRLYPYIFSNPRLKNTLQMFFAQGLDQSHSPLFSHLLRWNNTSRIKTFFSDDLKYQLRDYSGLDEITNSLPANFQNAGDLSKAQYLESSIFMSNYLLCSQGDRVAMANSIELRVPYLDHRIVEFMARVPQKWKLLGTDEKYILKKTYKDILPDSITKRAKRPYRAPIVKGLMNSKTSEMVYEMLSENSIKAAGFFDHKKVSRLLMKLEKNTTASEFDNMALIGILSTQMIHKQFTSDFFDQIDKTQLTKPNEIGNHNTTNLISRG